MSAHAYTEDQQAPRTLTRPLPAGEEVEQPAIGLFAEQVALPHPHPRPFSHWEKGGRQAGLRVRSLVVLVSRLRAALERLSASRTGSPALPPEAISAAVDELTRDPAIAGLPRLLSRADCGVSV